MLKRKSLLVAAIAATVSVAALSSQAYASDDALLGAVVGAGVGAAIGHSVQGRNGAIVGGAIGAVAGATIAANTAYYGNGYYAAPATAYAPAPVYYDAAPTYYQPAPVYYPAPNVVYAPRVDYVHYYGPRYVGYAHDRGHAGWHGDDGHHGH